MTVEELKRALENQDPKARIKVVRAAAKFGRAAMLVLVDAAQDKDDAVASVAAISLTGLVKWGDSSLVEPLAQILEAKAATFKTRAVVATLLGEIGSTSAVEPLTESLLQPRVPGYFKTAVEEALSKLEEEEEDGADYDEDERAYYEEQQQQLQQASWQAT